MYVVTSLVLMPALASGSYVVSTPPPSVNLQAVCDFHNTEIEKLKLSIDKLAKDVDVESDLYRRLYASIGEDYFNTACGVVGYRVLPYCATNEQGTHLFDKLEDKCAENRTSIFENTIQKMLNMYTTPSGKDIFRSCKDISMKGLLAQFKKMQALMSGLCDEYPSGNSRTRRSSYDGGYYPGGGYGDGYFPAKKGGFDPNTIWFQYLLCQEQKISCYFFTQGWNQKDYGQYYLYQNVLDTSSVKPPGTNDLLALALLSGTGKRQYYPHEGYPAPAYPPYKKRRSTGEKDSDETEPVTATKDGMWWSREGLWWRRGRKGANRKRRAPGAEGEVEEFDCEGDC